MSRPDSRPSSENETSRTLIQAIRDRDEEAWQRLVDLYAPLVWYWCRQHPGHRSGLLSEDDLRDVMQEVFQTIADRLDRFEKKRPGDTFRGWLRTVTRNKLTDRARVLSREPRGTGGSSMQRRIAAAPDEAAAVGDDGESPEVGPSDETVAEARLLQRAVDQIRPHFQTKSWQAFWRTTVDGLSAPEVARELDMSPGAVRVAKWRVLQRLRQELGEI